MCDSSDFDSTACEAFDVFSLAQSICLKLGIAFEVFDCFVIGILLNLGDIPEMMTKVLDSDDLAEILRDLLKAIL